MKILAKLLVGFLSIALLCAVVGAVGFSEVGTLGASIGEMASKTIPSIKHLNIIAKEFLKVKVAVRNMANPIGLRQAGFLEENRDLVAIGGWPVEEFDHGRNSAVLGIACASG